MLSVSDTILEKVLDWLSKDLAELASNPLAYVLVVAAILVFFAKPVVLRWIKWKDTQD